MQPHKNDTDTPGESLATLAERLDRSGMATVIERTPIHIEIALQQALPEIPAGPFD